MYFTYYTTLLAILHIQAVPLQNTSEQTANFIRLYGDYHDDYYYDHQDRDPTTPKPINSCDSPADLSKRCRKRYDVQRHKPTNFYSAKAACENMNMQLVSIENQAKWGDVVVAIKEKGDGHYWTSALKNHKTGQFVWGNRCPLTFSQWLPNQPDNALGPGAEDCIEIYPNYRWNDYPCVGHSNKYYICESLECV